MNKSRFHKLPSIYALMGVLLLLIVMVGAVSAAPRSETPPELLAAAQPYATNVFCLSGEPGWTTRIYPTEDEWVFNGRDVTLGDEECIDKNLDPEENYQLCQRVASRVDQPDNISNQFQIMPCLHKLIENEPNHDWYLLELRLTTDANVTINELMK